MSQGVYDTPGRLLRVFSVPDSDMADAPPDDARRELPRAFDYSQSNTQQHSHSHHNNHQQQQREGQEEQQQTTRRIVKAVRRRQETGNVDADFEMGDESEVAAPAATAAAAAGPEVMLYKCVYPGCKDASPKPREAFGAHFHKRQCKRCNNAASQRSRATATPKPAAGSKRPRKEAAAAAAGGDEDEEDEVLAALLSTHAAAVKAEAAARATTAHAAAALAAYVRG